ncbi:MAG: oxidoreductase family protein [Planctomycetota bacterium]
MIQRARLIGAEREDVVIKHIDLSSARENRRGWGGDVSHQRKVRSYQVETTFYKAFALQCDEQCRVPKLIATYEKENQGGWILVLEDLDSAGFSSRKHEVTAANLRACLSWLANFHATFMNSDASGLWPIGTYWHLDTRPDELGAMEDSPLKRFAAEIDRRLYRAQFQTLVHGDAKVANFCFSDREDDVAAVDFQYVGRGCGMKDVAYFVSSCLSEEEAAEQQESLLSIYFDRLQEALTSRKAEIDFSALEGEWRELYPFAWADFCRFLSGWSPGHWKLNTYSDRITESVIDQLADS